MGHSSNTIPQSKNFVSLKVDVNACVFPPHPCGQTPDSSVCLRLMQTEQTHTKTEEPRPCVWKSPDTFQTSKSTHTGKKKTMEFPVRLLAAPSEEAES